MATVEFKKIVYDRINGRPVIGNLYTVNTIDKDYSGTYVLKSEAEAEIENAAANCPKCFACGAELDTYAKCITCFDKIGAERDVLLERERVLEKENKELLEIRENHWKRIAQLESQREELIKYYENQNSENMNIIEALEERIKALVSALDGLYQHTKNDMQIAGLNIAAAAALDAAKEEG